MMLAKDLWILLLIIIKKGVDYDKTRAYQRDYEHRTSGRAE